jgi:hypothetical protein
MSSAQVSGIDYNEVPADFPAPELATISDRWLDWCICEELAQYVARECLELKARAHQSEREIDILYQSYLRSQNLGWGTAAELRWTYRRVAALLGWPAPQAVRRP